MGNREMANNLRDVFLGLLLFIVPAFAWFGVTGYDLGSYRVERQMANSVLLYHMAAIEPGMSWHEAVRQIQLNPWLSERARSRKWFLSHSPYERQITIAALETSSQTWCAVLDFRGERLGRIRIRDLDNTDWVPPGAPGDRVWVP